MSRRNELERHRQNMGEIRNIMNSMKTLAYMETRKLARFQESQLAVVNSIEAVAADFLSAYRHPIPETGKPAPVYLLIGSERGFCGDFNQSIANHLASTNRADADHPPELLVVGRKLHSLYQHAPQNPGFVVGASVAEEIPRVLAAITQWLATRQHGTGLSLHGIYHSADGVTERRLLPAFSQQRENLPAPRHPPILNLPPLLFFGKLVEHYLFALLHAMLYSSLLAENHRRASHLERAVKHLDSETERLRQTCSSLRQEEIIEEIEVIMLSASSLDHT